LYEMTTGRKAFSGANQASLISSILRDDPAPISQVQPLAPRAFDRIVRTCLAKDPEDRWQTARDVGLQLEFAASERSAEIPAPVPQRRRRAAWLPWLVAVAFAALAAIAMFRAAKPTTRMTHAIRFGLAPPENGSFFYSVEAPSLAVSPDGLQLAYVAGPPGARRIYRRLLADLEARPIPGTEGATSLLFSPDGESLAFFLPGKLKRLEISGGAPVPICDVPLVGAIWGTWGRGGNIIFAGAHGQAIYRVSAAGGAPAEAIRLDAARGETRILWPFFLPDGERFLYSIRHRDGRGDLMLAEPGKKPRLLMPMQSLVQYSDPGYLLFAREGALLAQRFDPEAGRTSGPPFSVAEHVRYFLSTGCVSFAASQSGTVVYQSQEDVRHLKWFDRTGRELGTVGPPGKYNRISMSPDGRRLFFDRAREGIWTFDIWSVDLERGMETPVTTGPETESMPLWLPGGRLVYSSVRGNPPQLIGRDLATGKEDELVPGGSFQQPQTVSPDGQFLLYTMRGERGFFDIWKYPLSGAGKPVAFLESPFDKSSVRFSPDGRFLAMITGESGRPEVYVTAFPGPSERIRVSTGGAGLLRWSRDGRELFYVSPDRQLMSVPIRTKPSLELGTPTPLFTLEGRGSWPDFEVAPDGRRVLAIVPEVVADELPLSVVVNWTPEAGK
ncbi:MAG TPA: hypothetical protein VFW15_03835, partial [Thermoanaerobaculia bacterium]|nr:hypothetical protein [Thermoanaerobaculia bacterium]